MLIVEAETRPKYPVEDEEIREYPFAAILGAKVTRVIVGYFLGPCYLYTARFAGWSGMGDTPAEAIAALVRSIEGPLAAWPETQSNGGANAGHQPVSEGSNA